MSEVINEIMKHSVISKSRLARLTISSIAAFVLSIGLARVLSGRCRPFTTVYEFRLLSQSHVASVHCLAGSEGFFFAAYLSDTVPRILLSNSVTLNR